MRARNSEPVVTTIEANPSEAKLAKNKIKALIFTPKDQKGKFIKLNQVEDIVLSSSRPEIAEPIAGIHGLPGQALGLVEDGDSLSVAAIDNAGKMVAFDDPQFSDKAVAYVYAVKGKDLGDAIITATHQSGVSATSEITVVNAADTVSTIFFMEIPFEDDVPGTPIPIRDGQSVLGGRFIFLWAMGYDEDGNYVELDPDEIEWKSSDESVAVVFSGAVTTKDSSDWDEDKPVTITAKFGDVEQSIQLIVTRKD
ncbi:hypothetical protein [Brevibacillus sp. NRS-1366]|uniref:hypothetical protein n=1 Tax=Brevibacillus sp. NRS-1366 TaxID=3233899 RepID=UPI003D1F8F1B